MFRAIRFGPTFQDFLVDLDDKVDQRFGNLAKKFDFSTPGGIGDEGVYDGGGHVVQVACGHFDDEQSYHRQPVEHVMDSCSCKSTPEHVPITHLGKGHDCVSDRGSDLEDFKK